MSTSTGFDMRAALEHEFTRKMVGAIASIVAGQLALVAFDRMIETDEETAEVQQ